MLFAAFAHAILPAWRKSCVAGFQLAIGIVNWQHFHIGNILQVFQLQPSCGRCHSAEIFRHQFGPEPHGLEDSRRAVGAQCRNSHFRHYLHEALAGRRNVIRRRLYRIVLADFRHGRKSEIRVHRRHPEAEENREVVDFAHFARFYDYAGRGPCPGFHKRLVHGSNGKERRNRFDRIYKINRIIFIFQSCQSC